MLQQFGQSKGNGRPVGKSLASVVHVGLVVAALAILGVTAFPLAGEGKWLPFSGSVLVAAVVVYLGFSLLGARQPDSNGLVGAEAGMWGSDHFANVLSSEMERARRFTRHLSLLVVELQTPPEGARDQAISAITTAVRKSLRQYDASAWLDDSRIGILLPETNPFEALIVAKRVAALGTASPHRAKAPRNAAVQAASGGGMSLGVGIACFPGDSVSGTELLALAKAAATYTISKGTTGIACAPDIPREEAQNEPEGGLKLTGEIFLPPQDKNVGFAHPVFRNTQSRP